MRCPECGGRSLKIGVKFAGYVSCCFTGDEEFDLTDTLSLRSEWDDNSACACQNCIWVGTVGELRTGPMSRSREAAASSPTAVPSIRAATDTVPRIERLQDVKHLLRTRKCAPVWQECIEFLLAELQRLESMLAMMRRAESESKRSHLDDDTALM